VAVTVAPAVSRARLRRTLGPTLRVAERVVGGGRLRERLLLRALGAHYRSKLRREWLWTDAPPHFFSHRIGAFDLAFGKAAHGPHSWFRAFHAAEVIRPGDVLLDLGCGDGFFTARFLAPTCAHVDAIDVDPAAIEAARSENAAANVAYHVADAAAQPFPRDRYDVVVWDGALGHFSPEATAAVLEKVRAALAPDGIFCGSEALGREGVDHLQFFERQDDLRAVLAPHFPLAWTREHAYRTGRHDRREAYWRAAAGTGRHEEASWRE
jgi:SAM-dependent methyltransferase